MNMRGTVVASLCALAQGLAPHQPPVIDMRRTFRRGLGGALAGIGGLFSGGAFGGGGGIGGGGIGGGIGGCGEGSSSTGKLGMLTLIVLLDACQSVGF